jgi:hypothetical protein
MNQPLFEPREISYDTIPKVELSSPEEFGDRITGATSPFIASGLTHCWKAMNVWSPAYFAEHYFDTPVTATVDLPAEGPPYALRPEAHVRNMTFSEFVDFIQTAENACYIHQMSVSKLPELRDDTEFEALLPPGTDSDALYFWLGSAATRSGLHFDRLDNINVQITGRKEVFLVPPEQARLLYPFKDNVEKSRVDPDNPQFDTFPELRAVRALRAELSRGDVLFLPKLWWHHFRSLEPSININCWYGKHVPLSAIFRVINAGGLPCWTQVAKDFVNCGLLGRDTGARLFSEPPTGKFLYDIMSQGIKRRLTAIKH